MSISKNSDIQSINKYIDEFISKRITLKPNNENPNVIMIVGEMDIFGDRDIVPKFLKKIEIPVAQAKVINDDDWSDAIYEIDSNTIISAIEAYKAEQIKKATNDMFEAINDALKYQKSDEGSYYDRIDDAIKSGLERGVDPNVIFNGQSLFHLGVNEDRHSYDGLILNLLKNAGAKPDAAFLKKLDNIYIYLNNDVRGPDSYTKASNIRAHIRYLCGIDKVTQDLHECLRSKLSSDEKSEKVNNLIRAGANLHSTYLGKTVLEQCIQGNNINYTDMNTLYLNGAKPNRALFEKLETIKNQSSAPSVKEAIEVLVKNITSFDKEAPPAPFPSFTPKMQAEKKGSKDQLKGIVPEVLKETKSKLKPPKPKK